MRMTIETFYKWKRAGESKREEGGGDWQRVAE